MAREARHFVDEAFFVIFGKYLAADFSKNLFNCVEKKAPAAAIPEQQLVKTFIFNIFFRNIFENYQK